jgi:hypothetical protein
MASVIQYAYIHFETEADKLIYLIYHRNLKIERTCCQGKGIMVDIKNLPVTLYPGCKVTFAQP